MVYVVVAVVVSPSLFNGFYFKPDSFKSYNDAITDPSKMIIENAN